MIDFRLNLDENKSNKLKTVSSEFSYKKLNPILLVSSNNNDRNVINIQRMFKEINLSDKYPFSKLYLENYNSLL